MSVTKRPALREIAPQEPAPRTTREMSSVGRELPSNWKRVIIIVWSGQALSILSSIAAAFAAMWYITETTASPLSLAFGSIASLLPTALLSPLGGVAADRLNRKWLMVAADGTVGLISLALGVAVLIGQVSLPLVLLVLAVRAAAQAFHAPAMNAVVPLMVPERELVRVNSLSQMLTGASGIAGPVLGILLYTVIGLEAVLFLDALGAALACGCLLFVAIPAVKGGVDEERGVWVGLRLGLRLIRDDRGVGGLIALSAGAMILFVPLGSLFPLMTYSWFAGSGYQASLVEAVFGIGLVIGSVALLVWGGGRKLVPLFLISGLVVGLTVVGCGLLGRHQFVLFVVLAGVMAMGISAFTAPILPLMQKRVPEHMLGRVTSLFVTATTLASPLGLLIAGVAAEGLGLTRWFVLTGVLLCLLQLVAWLSRSIRSLDDPRP